MGLLAVYFSKSKKSIIRFDLSSIIFLNPFVLESYVKNIGQADSCSVKGRDHELKRYKKIDALKKL